MPGRNDIRGGKIKFKLGTAVIYGQIKELDTIFGELTGI